MATEVEQSVAGQVWLDGVGTGAELCQKKLTRLSDVAFACRPLQALPPARKGSVSSTGRSGVFVEDSLPWFKEPGAWLVARGPLLQSSFFVFEDDRGNVRLAVQKVKSTSPSVQVAIGAVASNAGNLVELVGPTILDWSWDNSRLLSDIQDGDRWVQIHGTGFSLPEIYDVQVKIGSADCQCPGADLPCFHNETFVECIIPHGATVHEMDPTADGVVTTTMPIALGRNGVFGGLRHEVSGAGLEVKALQCAPGKYRIRPTDIECADCPPGTYHPGVGPAFACLECGDFSYAAGVGATNCTACQAFSTTKGTPKSDPEHCYCREGYYTRFRKNGTRCVRCEPAINNPIRATIDSPACPADAALFGDLPEECIASSAPRPHLGTGASADRGVNAARRRHPRRGRKHDRSGGRRSGSAWRTSRGWSGALRCGEVLCGWHDVSSCEAWCLHQVQRRLVQQSWRGSWLIWTIVFVCDECFKEV